MLRDRLALHLTAACVTTVILAPVALPGYVLTYDMNFVPAQPLRWDLIAPIDGSPRAVPLDAAVSLANTVFPGWLLQRLVLAAIIWAAVVGAGRLVPTESAVVRVVAGFGYGWTPFLAERLLIGQWGLLVAYAALPWLVLAALDVREGNRAAWPRLVLTAGLSALTPTGGLIAAVVCLALLPWRRWAIAAPLLLLVNSPWLVAALVTQATSRSDPAGVAAFAARAENWGGALVALLGTGGIWNSETTPASRSSPLVPFLTLGLLILAFYGYQKMRRRIPNGLLAVALTGLALAVLSTHHIGAQALSELVGTVPGMGLLRDSQKFVLPYALLLVICLALGAERLAARLPKEPARVLLAGTLLLAIAAVPDLAFGGAGALKPVSYPADWEAVASIIEQRPGPVLSAPLSEYRRYPWNRNRVVLDPAPRYFDSPVLADDALVVDGKVIAGENPRLRETRARVAAGEAVAAPSIRWVLVQDQRMPSSALSGLDSVYNGQYLTLYHNPAYERSTLDGQRHVPIIVAEIAALLALIVAAGMMAASARR